MKVLLVDHTSLVSGAQRALLDLIEALPASVTPVLMCPEGPLADMARATGTDVIPFVGTSGSLRLHPLHTLRTGVDILRSARALNHAIRTTGATVVHANSIRAGLIAGINRRFTKVPTVVHIHDALPASRSADGVRGFIARTADAVVTISDYTTRNFVGEPAPANVHMLFNPLDVERFDPSAVTRGEARRRLGLEPDADLIGLVAQITPWKGQDTAIRAMRAVVERHPRACLLLVGEAKFVAAATRFDNRTYERALHDIVRESGLTDNVRFLGERDDVPTIMRALDVLVAPSWEEPFGRSVIEAMALGTAVVATSVGGPPEYIDQGVDGVLAPPRDPGAWADAIGHLLDDATEREALGRRAAAKVRDLFERRRYAARMVDVYESLAPSRTPRRIMFVGHQALIGGGQRSLLELIAELRDGADLAMACPEGPLAEAVRALGVEVHTITSGQLTFRFSPIGTPRELVRTLRARRDVRRHIRAFQPDVVHANSLRAALIALRVDHSCPVVTHCRDLLPPGPVSAVVKTVVVRGSACVIAVSEAAAERLGGSRWRRRNITVIDNPVDTERFDPARHDRAHRRAELGIERGPVLGVIAQITRWKGQALAIAVLDAIRKTYPDASLLIVGEAKFVSAATTLDNRGYEEELHAITRERDLSGAVRFLGERGDVDAILSALDVLLVPSTEEPFGRTIIESMAMGVPVVATNRGGPPSIIRIGVDGEVADVHDAHAWAEAVKRQLERAHRADSRSYALERFSRKRHADAVASVYSRVLSVN